MQAQTIARGTTFSEGADGADVSAASLGILYLKITLPTPAGGNEQ